MADGGADYEEALMSTVNEIWEKWDKDANGHLDRSEMRAFIQATLCQAGIESQQEMSDEEFNAIFTEFDIDESGTIEKDEMAILVKRMAQI